MGQHTDIQWSDSTVNPITGCDGCELWKRSADTGKASGPCYAGNLHETRLAKTLPNLYASEFTEVRLAPGRMAKAAAWGDLRGTKRPDKPWLDGLPRLIFVSDMGDLFSKDVPFDYIREEVFGAARSSKGQRHVWQLLTKQPSRLVEFGRWLHKIGESWPVNVWAGTSITSAKTIRRAAILADCAAPVKFLSVEPLLGPLEFPVNLLRNFQWMIVGGESSQPGHKARSFDLAWARSLHDQCRSAGIRFFLKQFGSDPVDTHPNVIPGISTRATISLKDHHGGDWAEWPADLRVREFPTVEAHP